MVTNRRKKKRKGKKIKGGQEIFKKRGGNGTEDAGKKEEGSPGQRGEAKRKMVKGSYSSIGNSVRERSL